MEMSTANEQLEFLYTLCMPSFRTERALNQHSICCKSKPLGSVSSTTKGSPPVPELLIPPINNKMGKDIKYTWGRYCDKDFGENVSFICEQVVYWKRNLSLLPADKAGKLCMAEASKPS